MAKKKVNNAASEALFEGESMEIYGSSMTKVEKKDPKRKTITPKLMSECLEGDIVMHDGKLKQITSFVKVGAGFPCGAFIRDQVDTDELWDYIWGEVYCIRDISKEQIKMVTMTSALRNTKGREG